jgi:hypothetical protein
MLFVYIGFMNLPFALTPIQINWITFGTVNIVATLVAFKIMRPAYMARFRQDVLDYVLTGAFIGSAMMALLYAVVFFATGLNTQAARSALSIFATFFGILIFWNTFGIDILEPRSFFRHWIVTVMGLFFITLVIVGLYLSPALFEFVAPTPEIIALITALLLLTMLLFSWNMRHRYLLNRIWALVQA